MFKRAGAIAATPVVLAVVLASLAVGTVSAKPTRSASIEETAPCHFTVTYSYSSVGGGNNLTLTVILYRQEVGTTDWHVVGVEDGGTFSGNGAASVSPSFVDSGQTAAFQYFGYGYLKDKNSRVIRNSAATTELTSTPETCA